jgi:hypothetical protein
MKLTIADKLAQAKAAGAAKKAATSTEPPAEISVGGPPIAEKKLSVQEKLAQAKMAGAAKLKAAAATAEVGEEASAVAAQSKPAPKTPAKSGGQALLDKLSQKGKPAPVVPSLEKQTPAQSPAPRAEELLAFYLDEVRPFLDEDFRLVRKHPFTDETAARMRFANQGSDLPDKLRPIQRRLEVLCDARRQFLEQSRIRAWLHYWLLVHAPLSAVLFVLLAVHIVMALRVVPLFG